MLPHGKEQFFVGRVSAVAEGPVQSVAAYAGLPEAGYVGVRGALVVFARGNHHNIALDGPDQETIIILISVGNFYWSLLVKTGKTFLPHYR